MNTDSLLKIYDTLPDDTSKASKWNSIALYLNQKGVYEPARTLAERSLALSRKINFKRGIIEASNNVGISYMYQGNYPLALKFLLESARYLKEAGNRHQASVVINNIAGLYYATGDSLSAMKKYHESFDIASAAGDKEVMSRASLGMGNVFYMHQRPDLALQSYRKSLGFALAGNHKGCIADAFLSLGNVYGSLERSDSSYFYFAKTLAMRESMNDVRGVANCQDNMGLLCLQMGRLEECEAWFKKSLVNASKIGALDLVQAAEADIVQVYEKKGNYAEALTHYKKMIAARDSLFNEENTKKLVQTEMQYEFERKEALARAEQDKKEAINQAEKRKQVIVLASVSGLGLLVLVFAIFAYRSFLQKKRANVEISHQKHIIEEKQKEILDSIYYARRIQRSLITSEYYISRHLRRLIP